MLADAIQFLKLAFAKRVRWLGDSHSGVFWQKRYHDRRGQRSRMEIPTQRCFVASPGLRPGLCRLRMTVALVASRVVGRDIPLVAFFAVLCKIQSLDLLFFFDPQPNGYIHDLESHKGADNRERPRHSYSYQLVG